MPKLERLTVGSALHVRQSDQMARDLYRATGTGRILPHPNIDVLVFLGDQEKWEFAFLGDDDVWFLSKERGRVLDVTHWMPLPSRPGKENQPS